MSARISLLSALSFFLSIALAPSPASAHSFSPTNTTTTLSGVLLLQDFISFACQVSIDVSIDGNGNATVTGQSLRPGSSLLCGSIARAIGTWTLSPDSATQATADISFTGSISNICSGTVTLAWDNANSSLTFLNTLLPDGFVPCFVNGTLLADPAITIVP